MDIKDVLKQEIKSLGDYTIKKYNSVDGLVLVAYGRLSLKPIHMSLTPIQSGYLSDIELLSISTKLRDATIYHAKEDKTITGELNLIHPADYSFDKGLVPVADLEKLLPDTDNAKEFLRLIEEKEKKIEVVEVGFK